MAYYPQGHFNVPTDPNLEPHWPYFIEKTGIEHRVIHTDIGRYLGDGAVIRKGTYQGREGYFYNGYRLLTPAQVNSLKEDSYAFQRERSERRGEYHYAESRTFRDSRNRWTQPDYPAASSGRPGPAEYAIQGGRGHYGYAAPSAPVYAPTRAHAAPPGADPGYYYTESGQPFYNVSTREYVAPFIPPLSTSESAYGRQTEVDDSARIPRERHHAPRSRGLPHLGVTIERTPQGYVGYFLDEGNGHVVWVSTPGLPLGLVTPEYLENLRGSG